MKQSKSLGQVFLKDQNYIQRILGLLNISGETVLEIGPGSGEISEQIAKRCKFLYCVEFDPRFVESLSEKFKNKSNIKIIHSDILKFSFSDLKEKPVVFGNVPYQISNSIISYLIDNRAFIKNAYLTFQKEFVDKLIAKVSTKDYSFLSCYMQYYAKVNKLFDIPKGAFSPIPKVDSSFIEARFNDASLIKTKNEEFLFKIIRHAFNQRRKKISNSLSGFCPDPDFFSSLKIDANFRAENVSLEKYILIADKLCEVI
ncbi:MAG: 16S rRNA (adenine(1518)-N(6)/adenine(1519)-N(6))-dimethyltransferase RsmA [Candidatus Omnitrophota bacterium]